MNLPLLPRAMYLSDISASAWRLRRNLTGTPWRRQIRTVSRSVAAASSGTVETWIFHPCSVTGAPSGRSEVHSPERPLSHPGSAARRSSANLVPSSGSRAGVS